MTLKQSPNSGDESISHFHHIIVVAGQLSL
jgi:hypothetical protein